MLSALKNDPDLADIPVVMLTIVDDQNMGYALGAAEISPPSRSTATAWPACSRSTPAKGSARTALVVDDEPECAGHAAPVA